MATAWVTEYQDIKTFRGNRAQLAKEPAVATQTITYTTTTASSAFNAATNYIRFISTTNCHVLVGLAPTATTSTTYVPAGQEYYCGVHPGHKIAAVTAA